MATKRRRAAPTGTELHRAWLELVEVDGPFLAVPTLKRVWPQGMPPLGRAEADLLREAKTVFERAWELADGVSRRGSSAGSVSDADSAQTLQAYADARDVWVRAVLTDILGWGAHLTWDAAGFTARSPDHRVAITASAVLEGADGPAALIACVPRTQSLHTAGRDGWAATEIDRMEVLLRGSGVPIGVVTDGRWWALVCAREDAMVASGVVDASTWVEEPATRDAFVALLQPVRLLGGKREDRLPALFEQSVLEAEEITEALGAQVRRAVELLIQAFSETAAETIRRGGADPLPERAGEVYDAAVTAMMRVVFLLYAEERGLLPQGELFAQGYGIAGELDTLDARALDEGEEALDGTYLTWHRLLATSQALYAGASFENMRMPAYGGSLFDPSRYPFLLAVTAHGTLALPVSDRVMLHVLRSVQVAVVKGESRRISFRTVDVEQIGYIYEGLLGYSCARVHRIQVGLLGKVGAEPEVALADLERLAAQHADPKAFGAALVAHVKTDQPSCTPPSAAAMTKAFLHPGDREDYERQVTAIAAGDAQLRDRLAPWAGIVRRDLRGRPMVVLDGGLLVVESPSRRNAGAHYTPRSLAEQVVLHALEPLCYSPGPYQTPDRDQWRLTTPMQILSLKVADIACGSGAFLVAAARYLGERLVEAWTAEARPVGRGTDLLVHAVREVVASCLYGADINPMAVEMCKLSLWLVSLDPDLPFSFVDDKVLVGNSLLGITDPAQLRHLHINGADARRFAMLPAFDRDIGGSLQRVAETRRVIASPVVEGDPMRDAAAKTRQLRAIHTDLAMLAAVADAVVAAGLRLGGKPGPALDTAYEDLRVAVARAFPEDGSPGDRTFLDAIIDRGLTPQVGTDYQRWQPLHWALEVPDVLGHGGFDAVVGNPPFLGGKKISIAVGSNLREWLVNFIADRVKGNADLVAYFFLRAQSLLRPNGTLGLIATNTVAQGDTREVGLDRMAAAGLTITRAIQSAPWPSSSANLEYAGMWGTTGPVSEAAVRVADGIVVHRISTLLEAEGAVTGNPIRLRENTGIAYIGSIVNGIGFTMPPEAAQDMIAASASNAQVLFPYLIGDEVNTDPRSTAARWVVDFGTRDERACRQYAAPFAWVETRVRPHRLKLANKPSLQRAWWRYERPGPAMRRAIAGLDEVLVIALVSKTVMPMRVPTGQVFSHKLGVFATDSFGDQAVLSSSIHSSWVVKFTSTLGTGVNYSPSDVFETFPRPEITEWLNRVGMVLETERREMMLRRGLGLTSLYNLVNDPEVTGDPDVERLRAIHVELDEAVMAAYGWADIPLGHGFHTYRQMRRWTVSPTARVEILDRLLEENHRRAAAELGAVEQAATATVSVPGDTMRPKRTRRASTRATGIQGEDLFT